MKKNHFAILSAAVFFIFITLIFIRSNRNNITLFNSDFNNKINNEFQNNQEAISSESTSLIANDQLQQSPIQIIAQNLDIPWEIVWLPDDSMLVTQRGGTLLRISNDTRIEIEIDRVTHEGEGGLLGMTLHPNFSQEENSWLYLYFTAQQNDEYQNQVERYRFDLDTNSLTDREVVLSNIPGDRFHNGGRIAFGPDNKLYIATGDIYDSSTAQNLDSLAGKILRIEADGSTPQDNPFNNLIYSYGHRNPQGLAWDSQGRLWSSEHGPSGYDEINLIIRGGNYGWPIVVGDESRPELISPVIHSGVDETWAPSALEIIDDRLLFVGLRGSSLYSAIISDNNLINFDRYLSQEFGRLRIVKYHSDYIYLATNNTDGRGSPQEGDDKIIKIHPSFFEQ